MNATLLIVLLHSLLFPCSIAFDAPLVRVIDIQSYIFAHSNINIVFCFDKISRFFHVHLVLHSHFYSAEHKGTCYVPR